MRSERVRPPRHQRRDIGEGDGGGKKRLGKREDKNIAEGKGKEENMRKRKGEDKNGQGWRQERVRERARTRVRG